MSKIIGITVGTPLSLRSIKDKLQAVTSVNGVTPDEHGNIEVDISSGGVSSWNDLTDRPFYEEITTVGGDTFTWDGNTEGLVAVEPYHKVSDAVPVLEDFMNGVKLGVYERNFGEQSLTMTYEEICTAADDSPGFIPLRGVATVVLVDNATTKSGNSTVVFPEAGVYLISRNGSYATFITINGYDGFPTSEKTIVKTIDHKYLPEALQFGEVNTFDPLVYDSTKEYETIEVSAMGDTVPFYKIAEYIPVTTDDASTLYIAAIDPTTGANVELDVGVDNVGGIQTVEHGWMIGDDFMIGSDGQCAILGDPLPSGIWVPDLSSMDIGMIFSEMILRPKTIVKTVETTYLPEHLQFGETTIGSDTLTWDGNTDGLYIVGNMFAKISNATPTMEDFANGCIRETLVSGKVEIASNHISTMEGALCVGGEAVLIIPNDNMMVGGLLFEQAGVYTIYAHPDRLVSLTIPGYTGFITTTIKTIDPKYLPENTSGGGNASSMPDEEMLEFLMDMDIVQPLSNTNNAVYTDGNDKLYVL